LRVTVRRVTRLERAGLKQLRAGCGVTSARTETIAAIVAPTPETPTTPGPRPKTTKPPTKHATPAPKLPSAAGVKDQTATNLPRAPQTAHGVSLLLPLALLAIAAAGFLIARRDPRRASPPPAS